MKSLKNWKPETFEVTGGEWTLQKRKNNTFDGNGSDKSGKNKYTFNSLGFRGDEFPFKDTTKKTLMTVGCSHTEGVGVNDWETWPYYISEYLNFNHINFGFTGRSNDYISRVILTYTELVNPDLILIMYTYPSRHEYYTEEGDVEPFHMNPWDYFKNNKLLWENIINYQNKEYNFQNWYKNHLLITNFLENKGIPFCWNGTFMENDYIDDLRFDGDYPNLYNKHASAEQNNEYSKKLYNFIKEKNLI